MELKDLYKFVLLLILVGMVIGVGIVSINGLTTGAVSTYTTSSETITLAMGNMSLVIESIATNWLGLIVIIVVLAIIITIMIKSFTTQGLRQ